MESALEEGAVESVVEAGLRLVVVLSRANHSSGGVSLNIFVISSRK